MICPKCGLDQEERLDCKECGIVFSKYNALFSSLESPDASEEEVLMKNEIQDLHIQVRELSSRLMDVGFEKAERKKLRLELNDIKKQIHQNQFEMEAHMQQIEEILGSLPTEPAPQITPEVFENLPKSDEIEQKASELKDSLNHTNDQLTSLWEKTGQDSRQITELRDHITELRDLITYLRNEIHETKSRMASIEKNQINDEPKTIYEDDVKAIRKNLDELGQFISDLGRKP